jgi:RNA polymerase sigma-70 factor (ECF subfamily)
MDRQSEVTLITRLKAGDIDALTPLVRAYQQKALRTAWLVTQDSALAEDVTQAAFVQAYQCIGQFDVARPFLPWFLRIVVNLAVKSAGKQSRTLSLDAAPDLDGETAFAELLADHRPDPETEVEQRELAQTILQLLEQLSPDQRAVIVLRYYVDLTETQMADVLNLPTGTVKSRLHAARRQLRRLIRFNPI